MYWKIKSLIQNVVARLPSHLGYALYYTIQRRFGGLRNFTPNKTIKAAQDISKAIRQNGRELTDGTFLEVGTGRRINLPILMWLMGAKRVITVDLHPYLKEELVAEDLFYFQTHREEVAHALSENGYRVDRFKQLVALSPKAGLLKRLLELCNIQYLAPANAAQLPLETGSVDFHVSVNVFEHISPNALKAILEEASRVVGDKGLAVHRIDHSDHFSHSDRSLSSINFLRYSEKRWARLAGNRYMYMNRLQMDDFQELFEQNGQKVLTILSEPNQDVLRQLQASTLPLDPRFAGKSKTTLATLTSLFVGSPRKSLGGVAEEHAA